MFGAMADEPIGERCHFIFVTIQLKKPIRRMQTYTRRKHRLRVDLLSDLEFGKHRRDFAGRASLLLGGDAREQDARRHFRLLVP